MSGSREAKGGHSVAAISFVIWGCSGFLESDELGLGVRFGLNWI